MRSGLKRVLVVSFVILVTFAAVGLAEPVSGIDYTPMDIGPELRAEDPMTVDIQPLPETASTSGAVASSGEGSLSYEVGDVGYWLALDDYQGYYYFKTYTLRGMGENCEVWVANDLSFPEGDPRNDRVDITQEQVDYLISEFDNNIYPKELAFFGTPDEHTGINSFATALGLPADHWVSADGKGRVIIMVDNVRDESYYDPTYPSYIAGFYSSTYEFYTDRNIVTIDAYDWANRLGPDAARPHLYEGTVAHELQHLIHDDMDSDEETWVNEGISDLSEYLVGYGHAYGHVDFFLSHPENSLVAWGDQGGREILADYGFAYLMQLYLLENYGGQEFSSNLVANPLNGIAGVEDTLRTMGYELDFTDLYRDMITAVAIDDTFNNSNHYKFDTIDLELVADTEEAYATPGAPAWGTDFVKLVPEGKKYDRLIFNGVDFTPSPWSVVTDPFDTTNSVLWGNTGDMVDNMGIIELDLTGLSTATLEFDHYYAIEAGWDYGFVQVSTDSGDTWTSLSNEDTTDILDPGAHPKVVENVPGFTGIAKGWSHETFDLSPYAGQEILLNFRYVTDWSYQEHDSFGNSGWYIDNISVPEVGYVNDGSAVDFLSLAQITEDYVDYMVSFIGVKETPKGNRYQIKHVDSLINITSEDGQEILDMLNNASNDYVLMLVTYAAPQGELSYVDYDYEAIEHTTGPRK